MHEDDKTVPEEARSIAAMVAEWYGPGIEHHIPAHIIARRLSRFADRASASRPVHGVPAEWHAMESAPKDGREILIRTRGGLVSCKWSGGEWLAGWLGVGLLSGDPTGWMSLPSQPETPDVDPVAAAFAETARRYPHAEDALAFFWMASGIGVRQVEEAEEAEIRAALAAGERK